MIWSTSAWLSQLCVLLRRKLQPDASAFLPDCLFNLLASGNVEGEATALHQLKQLALVGKHYGAWQRRSPILFQELTEPTLSKAELQEDSFHAHTCAALAKSLASTMRRRKRSFAFAADLPCISLPNR